MIYSAPITVSITLTSLANNTRVLSTAIDNSVTCYDGGQLQVSLKTGATVAGAAPSIQIGILGSNDNSTFAANLHTSDIVMTRTGLAAATAYVFNVDLPSNLPKYFKIVVSNKSGGALSSTGGDFAVTMVGSKNVAIAPAATTNYATATAGAATITYTAVAGQRHTIDGVVVSYTGTTPAGSLTITDNGSTVFSADLNGNVGVTIPVRLVGTTNTNLVVTLSSGGSGVVGKVNVLGKGLV